MATPVSASAWLRRGHFKTALAALVVLGLSGTACQSTSSTRDSQVFAPPQPHAARKQAEASPASFGQSMEGLDNRRPLAVGDKVSFQVQEENEPPTILQVASSGEIQVPLVGRVPAAGRTPRTVAYAVKGELEKSLYRKATVIIALDSETTQPEGTIYVTGQVQSQGPQDIPRDDELTVSQAILKAGGFADFADKRRVTLMRRSADGTVSQTTIDVKDVLEKGRFDEDVVLQPGDYVFVRERMFNF